MADAASAGSATGMEIYGEESLSVRIREPLHKSATGVIFE
jgi:hypothetical protein